MHFTDGSPMVNSHCTLVPSTTNSLYSESSHHDNVHVVQLALNMMQDGNDSAIAENLVILSPSDSVAHEHSCKKLILINVIYFIILVIYYFNHS